MSKPLSWASVIHRAPNAPPLIMAHRGASDDAPENTLAAFGLALAQGADVLETDLRFTRDDEIVLIHDSTVERTTNGSGKVSDMTLSEIKQLRARRPPPQPSHPVLHPAHALHPAGQAGQAVHSERGQESASPPLSGLYPTGEGAGAGVPTLIELLEFTQAPLALELKDARFENVQDAQRLVDLLAKHNALERCVVVSFHLPRLRRLKSIAPTLPIGMITLSNPFPLYPTEFLGPLWPLLCLNPLYAWWARRLGKVVCPLDPAPEPRIRFYRRLRVSVLLTNHPARTVESL